MDWSRSKPISSALHSSLQPRVGPGKNTNFVQLSCPQFSIHTSFSYGFIHYLEGLQILFLQSTVNLHLTWSMSLRQRLWEYEFPPRYGDTVLRAGKNFLPVPALTRGLWARGYPRLTRGRKSLPVTRALPAVKIRNRGAKCANLTSAKQ
jgi:hypothetical protein